MNKTLYIPTYIPSYLPVRSQLGTIGSDIALVSLSSTMFVSISEGFALGCFPWVRVHVFLVLCMYVCMYLAGPGFTVKRPIRKQDLGPALHS